MNKPKILVFASGTPEGGGSGFKNLVKAMKSGLLQAEIVGVVSNHKEGGVSRLAEDLGIPFQHFPSPQTAEDYQKIATNSGADFFALSGWMKLVKGLDLSTKFNSKTIFNIHPGPLPEFGGPNMYGHHVHEAVIDAYKDNKVTHSAVTMHFVTEEYDRGPTFFEYPIQIMDDDNAETLAKRVNRWEHILQPIITNEVVNGNISWDGIDPKSLKIF